MALRVLVTGFAPFASHAVNVSSIVAEEFEGSHSISDPYSHLRSQTLVDKEIMVESIQLPVDEEGSHVVANILANGESFDAIIHIGLAEKSLFPRIEYRAKDIIDMRIPDNAGRQVRNSEISGEGNLFSTIDWKRWDLTRFSEDIVLSDDAGEYLCNETLYRTLHQITKLESEIPCFFLHIPLEENYSRDRVHNILADCLAHMLYPSVIEVTAALIQRADDDFIVARRKPGELFQGTWEFPGGKVEHGEGLDSAIIREIKEELDWDISSHGLVGTWYHRVGEVEICLRLMRCHLLHDVNVEDNSKLTAHDKVIWHPKGREIGLEWIGSDGQIAEFISTL